MSVVGCSIRALFTENCPECADDCCHHGGNEAFGPIWGFAGVASFLVLDFDGLDLLGNQRYRKNRSLLVAGFLVCHSIPRPLRNSSLVARAFLIFCKSCPREHGHDFALSGHARNLQTGGLRSLLVKKGRGLKSSRIARCGGRGRSGNRSARCLRFSGAQG